MKLRLPLLLLGLMAFHGLSQEENPKYDAAFKTVQLTDSSRTYKPNTLKTDRLHYRPLDLDMWYPTKEKKEGPMLFGDLYRLQEQRANKYQNETDYTGFSDEFILYLASGFGVDPKDGKRLLRVNTESYENSPAANGKFPLIIYMAGYNGMGWESYRLLERLAQNGFVVVSISSIGRYPGDMTNDLRDTLEQVEDGEFALRYLKKRSGLGIDFDRVGILGLSWGGMSGILMLDRHPEFGAMVSLDGSDIFYYGETDEDDAFLTEIYEADLIHPEKTKIPYLHIEAGDRLDEFDPTGEYHYYKKIGSDKYYLRVTDSKHEDFASLAWALKTTERQVETYERIMKGTLLFFLEKLQGRHGFQEYFKQLAQKKNTTEKPFEYSTEAPREFVLRGEILDSKTKEGLPYANIGVLHREIGTVSNKKGTFEFQLLESNANDTLRISMIGYKPKTVPIKNLLNQTDGIEIRLQEDISELNEVVVTAKKWKRKTLGNKTKSTFIGHLFHYEQFGKEMGIRMNIGRKPAYVDAFHFHVSYNRFSAKSFFRLNMYKVKNGKPAENTVRENIVIAVGPKQTGIISTDLGKYDIVLTEDVITTLEWVDNEGEIKPTESLAISLGMLTGGTYERNSKESKMKKRLKGLGLGFTLDVRY